MVTHLSYTNTPYYTEFPAILDALQSLGVHRIRDGYYPWAPSSPIVQRHQELAAAGIGTDYVIPYNSSTAPEEIEQFGREVRDMESLEAPNECDVNGGCGWPAIPNLVSFLPTVKKAGAALDVPVLGPSFVLQPSYAEAGNLDADMTANNLHVYFGGRNPGSNGWGAADAQGNNYGSFDWWLNQAAIDGPGLDSQITETGYMAYPTTDFPFTLPENVEASYTPRTLLLAFMHGFKATYLYELIDEVSSPGYGLLRSDLSPKPAFMAVKNLISLLDDTGDFTPGSLPINISGGGPTLEHVLFEKHDGTFWLALWLEQSSWDPVSARPIAVTPQNVTIELNSAYTTTDDYQFDKNGNVTRFDQPMTDGAANLTVTDKILMVEIAPN